MAHRGSKGILGLRFQLQSTSRSLHCCTWTHSYCWPRVLQLWLLCVLSSCQLSWTTMSWDTCNKPGFEVVSELNGLMVNLTVICGRDVANLSFSTGGLQVRSLRAAQECTVVTDNETISKLQPGLVSRSASSDYNKSNVSPLLSERLQESDIECHYFGCYISDDESEEYRGTRYFFVFPNVTCTFSRVFSSTPTIMPIIIPSLSSSLVTVDAVSSSIRTINILPFSSSLSSATSKFASHSGFMASNSPINIQTEWIFQKSSSPISVATVTKSISSPSRSISTDSGNTKPNLVQWIFLVVLIPVLAVSIMFISCLLLFTTKKYFNSSIKGNIYDPNEPFDIKFAPVEVKSTSLSPSFSAFSITTKLDPLFKGSDLEKVNLEQLDSILDPSGESGEVNSASTIGLSTDPIEDEDRDIHIEPTNMQNSFQPNSEYCMHLTDTPRVDNGFAWNEHEIFIDSGSEGSDGRIELLDDHNNIITSRQLSEVSDILTPDKPQPNSDIIHAGRLDNGYMHVGLYSGQQEGLNVTNEELNYDHESLIIQLDDMGPAEQRLMNSNGYIYEANGQLGHMDVQQRDQLCLGDEEDCGTNIILGLQA